ncbi:PAS/PAC sensor signal transduction histidine kinase [Candidatus Magnetobacterium bavaricum]|uniref:histidine kinase n=1 Tax=Candidatus Magnetobacterium bavaricum TaxID=29290 RepID=A0A0F3GU19_9BACT|nr:PAS/PAC sensor signal transduction histidine kinase [Candidatus Magnetobacterium bavaricum]
MNERKFINWLGTVFTAEGLKLSPPQGFEGEEAALALRIYAECNRIVTYGNLYMQTLNSMENYCELSIRALSAMINISVCTICNIDAFCSKTLEIFVKELDIENCSIMMLDAEGKNLMLVAGRGKGDKYMMGGKKQKKGAKIKIGEGIAGKVAETGIYISVSDVSTDPLFTTCNASVDVSSLLCVPINSDGKIIGVLNFSHPMVEAFDKNTINLMVLLGNFVGQMITIATLHNEISVWNEKLQVEVDRKTIQLSEKNLELSNLNRKLDERVQTAIENIRRQEYMLIQQSKLATMGEMIGAISHQWRQPLNAIALTVQDIQEAYYYGELNEEYIKSFTDTTMKQVRFMSKTMDDFRNFFKPSKEKVQFDVKSNIEELLSMFGQLFKKSDVDISVICEPDTILLSDGYPNEFKQVILNILNNAKDAIISKRQTDDKMQGLIEINIGNNEAKNKIILSMQDNGGGIPLSIIDNIFAPYYTTKGNTGTGIGLYMSKTIIETNMGGSLTVRNVDGGAEFMITLGVSRTHKFMEG